MATSTSRNYLNYTTRTGVPMAHIGPSTLSSFLIHDFGYNPTIQDWNHPRVDSPFWRLYHNPRPGCRITCSGISQPLNPDTCTLIPADTIFDCVQDHRPAQHLWIHFTLTQPTPLLLGGPVTLRLANTQQVLIQEAIRLHREHPTPQRDRQLHALAASLIHLASPHIERHDSSHLPDWLLEQLDFIRRNPSADLRNTVLAAQVDLPLEKFIQQFRNYMHTTPAAYVSETRIRLAAEALALTDDSIDQVAADKGFPNRHYFSRVFSRRMSCGPAEFRRRQRQN